LIRRTADIPNQKAAGPISIPKGQIITMAAMPKISAIAARASMTIGLVAGGAPTTANRGTYDLIIAIPRAAVAAAAAKPPSSNATKATGGGL
jgi:hypothetical protein